MEEAKLITEGEKIQKCLNIQTDVTTLNKKFTSRKYWKIINPSEKINLDQLTSVKDTLDKTSITLTSDGILIIQNTTNKRKRTDNNNKKYKKLPKHYDHVEHDVARNILLHFLNENDYLCKLNVNITKSGHTLVIEPNESIQVKNILKVHENIDTNIAWEFSWNPSIKIRIKFL